MAGNTKPKKAQGKSKGQEGRVTLRIRQELIEELQELADSEELSLSGYVRQLLKHEVVSKKKQEQDLERYTESQKRLQGQKVDDSRRRRAG